VISAAGITMDAQKVQTVLEWPIPHLVGAMRAFLGLAVYYHCFIRDYGAMVAPLTALLQNEGFKWALPAEATFHALQCALTTAPILQLLDFTTKFTVKRDASGTGLGAVLHQGAGPIAFFSRQLVPQDAKLAAYEHEQIGLVQVV
jgi:hypothetical protein